MRITRQEAKKSDWVVYNSYEGEIVALYTTEREARDHAFKQWFYSYCPYYAWE